MSDKKIEILPEKKVEEELSFSYLNAIASSVGIACERAFHDSHDADATLKKVMQNSDNRPFRVSIGIQLKSTCKILMEDDSSIHYFLEQDNYDDLRIGSVDPMFLAVLVLPSEKSEWIRLTPQELCIRKCMYIKSLKDYPESGNTSGKTIKFDKAADLLTFEKLNEIFTKIAEEA